MDFENIMMGGPVTDYIVGGTLGGLIALGIFVAMVILLAFYVYFAYTWMTIARKRKYKYSWLAWIPFANMAMMLQLGGFHWAWIFLVLVPILGWLAIAVLLIIATWRIFEARNYPGWLALSLALTVLLPKIGWILYLVAIGFVAYKDRKKR